MNRVFDVQGINGSIIRIVNNNKQIPIIRCTMVNEELHSFDNSPSLSVYGDGYIKNQSIHKKGILQSDGSAPSYASYYHLDDEQLRKNTLSTVVENLFDGTNTKFAIGPLKTEKWHDNGLLHSFDDKPSVIKYRRDGSVYKMIWHYKGLIHRNNTKCPACVIVDKAGNHIIGQFFYDHGNLIKAISTRNK